MFNKDFLINLENFLHIDLKFMILNFYTKFCYDKIKDTFEKNFINSSTDQVGT